MFKRKFLLSILGLTLMSSTAAMAQEQTTQQVSPEATHRRLERKERIRQRLQRQERRRDHVGREHRGSFLRQLDLTEAQEEQRRAIVQRRLAANKSQREELFQLREKRIAGTFTEADAARAKALREQIHASMQGMQAELEAILTAEQKAKLEERRKERQQRMEQRLKERQERLQQRRERLNTQVL